MDNQPPQTPDQTPPQSSPPTNTPETTATNSNPPTIRQTSPSSNSARSFSTIVHAINPVTTMFGVLIIVALVVIAFVTLKEDSIPTFNATELSKDESARLTSQQSQIEPTGEKLTISPNTEFKNEVEIEKSLEVVGDLTVLGQINWKTDDSSDDSDGGSAGGGSNTQLLQSAQITDDLIVGGNAQFDGSISANGGLNVNGELNTASLIASQATVNGDLRLNRHIVSGGGAISGSAGGAVGSGGTVNVSGDDIAGTVRINTGGSAPAGRLATVNFRTGYGGTPSVHITPVGSDSAAVDYYIERDSGGFSIYSLSNTPDNAQIQFDYFVVQ